MSASVKNLYLPSPDHRNTSIGGWDENFGDIHIQQIASNETQISRSARSSIAKNAVANGCSVFGTNDNDDPSWIRWRKDFDFPVCQVASTACGNVIAASSGGKVTLMRGSDGGVLATRYVTSETG